MIPLELLSVYLPYGLTCYGASDIWTIHSMSVEYISFFNGIHLQENSYEDFFTDYSPLLHPLSKILDFPELIEHILEKRNFENGFIDEWKNHLFINSKGEVCINSHSPNDDYILIGLDFENLYYWEFILLAKYHIDIFNLIGQGLAEPIK